MIALLTRKTQVLYTAVLEKVKELMAGFNPTIIMADFEPSLRNALRETFPQCTIKGCWFHYTQAVIRKIRKLGLTAEMTTNVEFKSWINSVLVVPLLPSRRIGEGYELLMMKDFGELNINTLTDYLTHRWKNRVAVEELSVYWTMDRKHNPAEAYNRKLSRFLIGNAAPNYFNFLRQVKESLKTSNLDFIRLRNGLSITRPVKKETVTLNNQFLRGWERLDRDQSVENFLMQMKYNAAALTDGDDNDGFEGENDTSEEEVLPPAAANVPNVDPEPERCPICLMDTADEKWAFVPCGHSPFCQPCSATAIDGNYLNTRNQNRDVYCPVCRQIVTSRY